MFKTLCAPTIDTSHNQMKINENAQSAERFQRFNEFIITVTRKRVQNVKKHTIEQRQIKQIH